MTGVSADLTPGEVMTLRFNAQSTGDFTSIYHSSHRLSTLRRSFTRLNDYLTFAAQSLSDQIIVNSFELLSEEDSEKKAYVLCKVSMSVQGERETFIEVAELRRAVVGWRFLHCARLPISALPDDLSRLNLKQFYSHPEAVVY